MQTTSKSRAPYFSIIRMPSTFTPKAAACASTLSSFSGSGSDSDSDSGTAVPSVKPSMDSTPGASVSNSIFGSSDSGALSVSGSGVPPPPVSMSSPPCKIFARSSSSIIARNGRMRKQVATVIGDIVMLFPGFLPSGTSLNSKGNTTGVSAIVAIS